MPSEMPLLATGCLALSIALTFTAKKAACRLHWLDYASHRSTHLLPTPRVGGVAIVLSFLLGSCWLLGEDMFRGPTAVIFASIAATSLVGLIDDIRSISAAKKLGFQFALSTALVMFLRHAGISPVDEGEPASVITTIAAILLIVWITNAYNFMDGIDGLAAGQTIIASLALAFVGFAAGSNQMACLMVLLACASFGFLVFNFPPASIFMGDVGSTTIGFTFATLPLLNSSETPIPVWPLAISMFLLDSTVTLLRRIWNGEDVFQAHRTHFYQRPLAFGVSHLQVTLTGWAAMLVSGGCAIAYAMSGGLMRLLAIFIPVAVFLGLATWVMRTERRWSTQLRVLRAAESRS